MDALRAEFEALPESEKARLREAIKRNKEAQAAAQVQMQALAEKIAEVEGRLAELKARPNR